MGYDRYQAPLTTGRFLRGLSLFILLAGSAVSARSEASLQGRVSSLDPGAGRLELSGVRVVISNAVILTETDTVLRVGDLKTGDRVDIRGAFVAPGVLAATRVQRTLRDSDRLQGRNERTDAAARTLAVGGITIKVPVNARIEDAGAHALPLEQCATNQVLICTGAWTGTNEFTASAITIP
jgi:hypothetical protein